LPKGHSVLQEEVKSLTKLTDEILLRLQSLELRFKDYRVEVERQIPTLSADMSYKPQFEKWPGNGASK
jgi:hypothetical protein